MIYLTAKVKWKSQKSGKIWKKRVEQDFCGLHFATDDEGDAKPRSTVPPCAMGKELSWHEVCYKTQKTAKSSESGLLRSGGTCGKGDPGV